jgi:hypothetical protein
MEGFAKKIGIGMSDNIVKYNVRLLGAFGSDKMQLPTLASKPSNKVVVVRHAGFATHSPAFFPNGYDEELFAGVIVQSQIL